MQNLFLMSPTHVPFEHMPEGQPQYLIVIIQIKELQAKRVRLKENRLTYLPYPNYSKHYIE